MRCQQLAWRLDPVWSINSWVPWILFEKAAEALSTSNRWSPCLAELVDSGTFPPVIPFTTMKTVARISDRNTRVHPRKANGQRGLMGKLRGICKAVIRIDASVHLRPIEQVVGGFSLRRLTQATRFSKSYHDACRGPAAGLGGYNRVLPCELGIGPNCCGVTWEAKRL
jgi:hypothetical protein